jgi:glycolate oxidase FAD binding subunit
VLPRPHAQLTLRLELTAAEAAASFNRWAGQPLPLSGAAWHRGQAWVRLSGAEPAVRASRTRLGGETVPESEALRFWEDLRHGRLAMLQSERLWRVCVPAGAAALSLSGEPLIDWGGALRWYADVDEDVPMHALAREARGTATCWRGPAAQGRFQGLPPALAQLHRRLKARFDPHGIFNRGRLIAGL